jgi:hypothetical protein
MYQELRTEIKAYKAKHNKWPTKPQRIIIGVDCLDQFQPLLDGREEAFHSYREEFMDKYERGHLPAGMLMYHDRKEADSWHDTM